MKIGYCLFYSTKNGLKLSKKLDMGRQVGQKWPQKIGYHMWMAPYGICLFTFGAIQKLREQQRVGRWSEICHFCPCLLQKKCPRRWVVKNEQNYVYMVIECILNFTET